MGRPKGSKNKAKKNSKKVTKVTKAVKQEVVEVKESKKVKLTVTRIVCSKCGEKKTTTRAAMDKLIALFGSIENVHEKYHCIKCRKLHNVRKDGRPKPEKKTRKPKLKLEKTEDGKIILPKYMMGGSGERVITKISREELFKGGPVCHNPEVFVNQNKTCNGCNFYEFCNCTSKNIVEEKKTDKKRKVKV